MTAPDAFTFAFSEANLAFGLPDDEGKELLARHAVSKGKLVRQLPERPDTSAGYLIAWPDTARLRP